MGGVDYSLWEAGEQCPTFFCRIGVSVRKFACPAHLRAADTVGLRKKKQSREFDRVAIFNVRYAHNSLSPGDSLEPAGGALTASP